MNHVIPDGWKAVNILGVRVPKGYVWPEKTDRYWKTAALRTTGANISTFNTNRARRNQSNRLNQKVSMLVKMNKLKPQIGDTIKLGSIREKKGLFLWTQDGAKLKNIDDITVY